jgi:GT2 family glycosyltransferase
MHHEPLISILIPVYNQAQFLPAALDSLIAQTYPHWEALAADDGSTDDTPRILAQAAAADARIRVYRRDNGGCAAALNTALRQARGRWIGWLSSDDLFEPDKLEIHLQAMRDHPRIGFFHSHFHYLFDDTGEKTDPDTWRPIPPPRFQVSRFFEGNYVHGNSVLIRKDILDRAGFFDETLRYGQDFDMWLRISVAARSHCIPRRTCVTRWHGGQTTNFFPVAGLYDSCRACLACLNAHPYRELFPLLDLARPDDAGEAAGETMRLVLNEGAYMYQLGYNTALFDRFREWLGEVRSPEAAARARGVACEALRAAAPGGLPQAWRAVLQRALDGGEAIVYRPVPPREVIDACLADPEMPERKKDNLRRYLPNLG